MPGPQELDNTRIENSGASNFGAGQQAGGSENFPAIAPPPVRGGRSPLALVVAAVVVSGMLYFGYHEARRSPSATLQAAGGKSALAGGKSSIAPDFTLVSLDGKSMKLSDLRGKAVLLNFWATWCGPCKIEMPWFVELQNEYGSQGLQIVGVAMDNSGSDSSNNDDIAKFAKQMGVNYPVLVGRDAVADQYGGVPALPESFFISRDGKIVDKIIGLRGKADIIDAIKKALNAPPDQNSPPPAATALLQPQN